ncbi:Uncharacterised protein [Vibrio cholerae]|nr:Uncharacterised protein [Vibrio cholerae]
MWWRLNLTKVSARSKSSHVIPNWIASQSLARRVISTLAVMSRCIRCSVKVFMPSTHVKPRPFRSRCACWAI